jgi:hypothetical protein
MKLTLPKFAILYFLTFLGFIYYFLFIIPECEIYWMHDDSITFTHRWFIFYCCYMFLFPAFLSMLFRGLKIVSVLAIVRFHYFFALTSALLLAFFVKGPYQVVDGISYGFADGLVFLAYFLLKLICIIQTGMMIIRGGSAVYKSNID